MAYIKYKELTKYFDFSKYVLNSDLPGYTLDYVYETEDVIVAYKTFRDYGLFTTEKIVLFDNSISVIPYKEIYTIPYSSISSCAIVYKQSQVKLKIDLDSGYQLKLSFVGMRVEDKVRLRLLYSLISRIISGQKMNNDILKQLMENKIAVKEVKNG